MNRADIAIAAARQCLHETWIRGAVTEYFPQLAHGPVQSLLKIPKCLSRPDQLSQFLNLLAEDRGALLADLASALVEQEKLDEAESMYQKSLALFERNPRREFRERTATTLSNLSTIAIKRKRFEEALGYSDRARAVLDALEDPPAV